MVKSPGDRLAVRLFARSIDDTTIYPGAGASSAEVRTNFTGTQVPALGWAWLTWLLKVGEAGRVVASICEALCAVTTARCDSGVER